jgi:SLT domain-containing protein
VESAATAARKGTLQVLEEIWAEREARGMVGRSKEGIDSEIAAMRDEDEKRMQAIEAIPQQPAKKRE